MIPGLYNKKREIHHAAMSDADKALYAEKKNNSQADADAIIALRNPTKPDSVSAHMPKRVTFGKIATKSNVGGERKTSGYRYNRNKPAKGSITRQ